MNLTNRELMLILLLVGSVALLVSTVTPRPLADRITEQFRR